QSVRAVRPRAGHTRGTGHERERAPAPPPCVVRPRARRHRRRMGTPLHWTAGEDRGADAGLVPDDLVKGGLVGAIEVSAKTQVKIEPLPQESPGAFALRDCALIAIATGVRAHNLKELQARIVAIEPGCLYYHFWGGLLRPRFDDPEYRNDFAIWVRNEVHDEALAEQLASVDPTQHETLDGLREAVLEAIESRLEVL